MSIVFFYNTRSF